MEAARIISIIGRKNAGKTTLVVALASEFTRQGKKVGTIKHGHHPALLDTVRVEAYGQPVPIQQVGSISAPEPRLLVVQPWDRSLIKAITRAIQASELGLNPTDDGAVVRVPIPALTEERRRDLVKLVSKLAEDGRVHVRQVRHDLNKDVKAQEHDGRIPEDEAKRLTAEVQKLTDKIRVRGGSATTPRLHSPEALRRYGNLPRPIAIIMDGNGRWARARGVPRLMSHTVADDPRRERRFGRVD